MKLELDSGDLKPEHRKLSAREVTYDKLTTAAQAAVLVVGRAVWYANDRKTYNAVYPPKT